MKILITGCHGQLGTELQKQLADEECAWVCCRSACAKQR